MGGRKGTLIIRTHFEPSSTRILARRWKVRYRRIPAPSRCESGGLTRRSRPAIPEARQPERALGLGALRAVCGTAALPSRPLLSAEERGRKPRHGPGRANSSWPFPSPVPGAGGPGVGLGGMGWDGTEGPCCAGTGGAGGTGNDTFPSSPPRDNPLALCGCPAGEGGSGKRVSERREPEQPRMPRQ